MNEVVIWHVNYDGCFFVRVRVHKNDSEGAKAIITRDVISVDERIWDEFVGSIAEERPSWLQGHVVTSPQESKEESDA